MGDVEDMKEDGEIESDEGEVYTKLERPQQETKVNSITQEAYNSESSANSDSDGETPNKFMKRLEKPMQPATTSASRSKNGHLWKNMLQEETLMETLKTCDVSSTRKRKFERGAESYDFENIARLHKNDEVSDGGAKFKRRKMEISGNDSSSSNASSTKSQKRARKNQNRNRKNRESKVLPDLVTLDASDDEFGRDMAEKLEEEKCDLILKVVSVIGREASLSLYKITQRIEREGGMLTMMKNRRRTPGGIFLFLLKTSDKIDEDLKKEIFNNDKQPTDKGIAERKMSSEQLSKDPPNSPANADFIENGKLTDPDLVSQKILNFTKPDEDVLELDYNDMDTF